MHSLSKKGSAEIVAFILILPLLLMPMLNSINMVTDLAIYNKIMTHTRKSMLAMESQGGMTATLHNELMSSLQAQGIDTTKVEVMASCAPVPYGHELALEVFYQRPMIRYEYQGFFLKRSITGSQMRFGPLQGISKRYDG